MDGIPPVTFLRGRQAGPPPGVEREFLLESMTMQEMQ